MSSFLPRELVKWLGTEMDDTVLQSAYTITSLLVKGKNSTVYSAIDTSCQKKVAIKEITKESLITLRGPQLGLEKAVDRVQRRLKQIISEVVILSTLSHTGIITCIKVHQSSHRIWFILELVDGCDLLQHVWNNGCVSETSFRNMALQMVNILSFCHEQDIYHRDVKLENVMINEKGEIKLVDFGLSIHTKSLLTTICGTPLYCSPEMMFMETGGCGYEGGPADVWSLGILFYALLTGSAPFDDSSLETLRNTMRANDVYYPVSLSFHVRTLLQEMLEPNPVERITLPQIKFRLNSSLWNESSKELCSPVSIATTVTSEDSLDELDLNSLSSLW